MWLLWLAAVAAVSTLALPDTPDYQICANGLFSQVKQKFDSDMNALDDKLMNVTFQIEQLCAGTPRPAVPEGTQEVSGSNPMLTMLQKIEIMEETLNQMQRKLNASATKPNLTEMQNSVDSSIEASKVEVQTLLESTVKKQDVKDIFNGGMNEVVKALEHFANKDTVLVTLNGSVYKMETDFVERTERLEEMVTQILNFTRLHPPSTTTPSGPVYPCKDSTFPGSPGYDVCQAAVRFNRCRLQTVAYHCCHTCTSHNKLPEMGPWRYENASRVVNTLDVLRFFTL
ncbi:uncharacterized protein LOC135092522 [Scylla paramamosain]|uniref:uncharacterized protein LOC135092522 n=1 Tax=Scylla paramamosain TaxID=85552 RepID=UPI0030827837